MAYFLKTRSITFDQSVIAVLCLSQSSDRGNLSTYKETYK